MARGTAWTTSQKTASIAHNKWWLRWLRDRSLRSGYLYVFTDGSSSGAAAAVVVKDKEVVSADQVKHEPTRIRNVGAELQAFLLGLRMLPAQSQATVVHDYLGISAWCVGGWQIKNDEVRAIVQEAEDLIWEKRLHINFIHHGGHQKDLSDMTQWNCHVDSICAQA